MEPLRVWHCRSICNKDALLLWPSYTYIARCPCKTLIKFHRLHVPFHSRCTGKGACQCTADKEQKNAAEAAGTRQMEAVREAAVGHEAKRSRRSVCFHKG